MLSACSHGLPAVFLIRSGNFQIHSLLLNTKQSPSLKQPHKETLLSLLGSAKQEQHSVIAALTQKGGKILIVCYDRPVEKAASSRSWSIPKLKSTERKDTLTKQTSTPNGWWTRHPTHKVNGSEAAMADLTEVGEQLLWIIFAEQICHIGVFEIARPCTRGHGQGLQDRGGHGSGGGHRGGQQRFPPYIAEGRFQTECLHLLNHWSTNRNMKTFQHTWKYQQILFLFTEDVIKKKKL